MTIRLLKFTEYTENALCIYRRFCFYRKIVQALIVLRIVLELLVTTFHCVVRSFEYLVHPQCRTDNLYFYMTNLNSIIIVILGFVYSKKYKRLTVHLNSCRKFFNTDENYVRNLQAKHSTFVGFVFIFSLVKVVIFGYIQLSSFTTNLHPFLHYVFQINLLLCDFRYIFEFLVLYCVLYVMSQQLLCVTRSIDNKYISKRNIVQLTNEVENWSVIYKHIRESAKLFNDIFGVQLTVMLTTTMFYYVIFLYTVASQSVTGQFTMLESSLYIGTFSLMLTILFMVAKAAQVTENSADILRRRLCRLLIVSIANNNCYKPTKGLLRMMSTRPIRVRAFGSISIDMTLLPTCVSFFTTYTVIALQFNNVV